MGLSKVDVYFVLLMFAGPSLLLAVIDKEDCELYAPNTMVKVPMNQWAKSNKSIVFFILQHEFCCDIHEENGEFLDCEMEWSDKIHQTTDEQGMNYDFVSFLFFLIFKRYNFLLGNQCLSECVYNKTEFLGPDRKSLRMNVIKRHLNELHGDDNSERLLYNTYLKCAEHGKYDIHLWYFHANFI